MKKISTKKVLPLVAVGLLLVSVFVVSSYAQAPRLPDIYDELLRIGGVVDDIESKLDVDISDELMDINWLLEDVYGMVDDIEFKLDPEGSFYSFVDYWFMDIMTVAIYTSSLLEDVYGMIDYIDWKLGDPWDTPFGWPTFADALADIKFEIIVIDTKIDSLFMEVDDIETKLDELDMHACMMLGSFSDHFHSPTTGEGSIESSRITSSIPAIFTISLNAWLKDPGDEVWIAHAPNKWMWATMADGTDVDRTITLAGYGVVIVYRDVGPSDLEVSYTIVVQGEKGTEVKIGDWTP